MGPEVITVHLEPGEHKSQLQEQLTILRTNELFSDSR